MAYVGDVMILIDSNVWCYYFDKSCKEHEKAAKAVEATLAKEDILTNSVIIMEVSHFLVKNLGPRIGKEKIDTLLSFPMIVVDLDFLLMKKSIDLLCDYSHAGIGGRDAAILATLKHAKGSKLMSHDSAFKKVDWVNVVDPV